jgi:LPXTG-motif cell wall-anchored protein
VDPTEDPTPVVDPTEDPTPVVDPTEDPTPVVDPTEDPTPVVDPTDDPAVENHRVVVCHWVPAHEGSFLRIEIDQNGLNGHDGHVHDVVGPVDDLSFSCETDTETDPTPIEPTDPTEPTVPTTDPTDPSSPFVPEDDSDNASGVVTVDDLASSSAAPTQLAHTGTQAGSIALLGAGLLAAGTFVLVAGRKRREV